MPQEMVVWITGTLQNASNPRGKNSKTKRTGEEMKFKCSCQFNKQTRCVDKNGNCEYCGLEVKE